MRNHWHKICRDSFGAGWIGLDGMDWIGLEWIGLEWIGWMGGCCARAVRIRDVTPAIGTCLTGRVALPSCCMYGVALNLM